MVAHNCLVSLAVLLVGLPASSPSKFRGKPYLHRSLRSNRPFLGRRTLWRREKKGYLGSASEKHLKDYIEPPEGHVPPEIVITQRATEGNFGPIELREENEGCTPIPSNDVPGINKINELDNIEDEEERQELEDALRELQGLVSADEEKGVPSGRRGGGYGWKNRARHVDTFDELDMSVEDEDSVFDPSQPDREILKTVIDSTARDFDQEILTGDKFWGDTAPDTFRSGFVSIIGSPNMGKSTLMNTLVGERVSITSPKAQTTRHRIMGIISDDNTQIIYWDTPGILSPNYMLQERMLAFIHRSIADADMLLIVTDIEESQSGEAMPYHPSVLERLSKSDIPILVAINKIDLLPEGEEGEAILSDMKKLWQKKLPDSKILPVSAKDNVNTDILFESLQENLPTHPPWFDRDTLTDRNERFFVSELIREQIFEIYHQEIPYSCEVTIKKFKSLKDRTIIDAYVHVDRDSQKGIVIGQKGSMIKKLSMGSRKSIEEYLRTKVHLTLEVKVAKDWRTDDKQLRGLGYYNA
mmetsp:Transcript_30498/g.48948  ORF Transcript_30498/g.48948 Transcript_30498/m.48948 type:complete len:527 (-) Transcript_30498:52-1632(-)